MISPDPAPLPPELLAEIVSIAAWKLAELDKPWLARIARTSRLILHTVTPILYHTVILTARNHDAIFNCTFYGNFSLTRHRWVGKALAAAFARVEHVACTAALYTTLRSVQAQFCSRMLTLRGRMSRDDPQLARVIVDVTHLHLHLAGEPHALLSARPEDTSLRFVVLEMKARGAWLVGSVLSFFLACPALASAQLAEYVVAHGELRI